MEELNVEFDITEENEDFDVVFQINISPTQLSELDDDVGIAKNADLTELQTQVNNFQLAEDTEMTNIVEIIQRCADNLIDLTEIEI